MHDPLPWNGTRVALRRLCPADLARFQAYRHDAEVGRYQGWEPQSDEEARAFIGEMSQAEFGLRGEWLQIAIADATADGLLGDIGLFVMRSAARPSLGSRSPATPRAAGWPRRRPGRWPPACAPTPGCGG